MAECKHNAATKRLSVSEEEIERKKAKYEDHSIDRNFGEYYSEL